MNFFIVICFQFLLRAEPWYCFDGIISRVEIMALASNLALRRVNFLESKLKRYYDQKNHFFFSSDFESVFAKHPTGKILRFVFYPKAVYFECKFWI